MNEKIDQRARERNVWRGFMWGGMALALSLPALAMTLGADGVDWTTSDFIMMGSLMVLLGVAIEGAVRRYRSWHARALAIFGAVAVFVAIWVELAVGIFGTPFAGS